MQSLRDLNIEKFDLCSISGTEATMLQGFGFPVGDQIKGLTSKTLNIGGQLPSMLYNFEGTHTFAFTVTDEEGQKASATLTLLVDKAHEEGGAGNAPSIVMLTDSHNLAEPYVMNEIKDIEITIAAHSEIARELFVTVESQALGTLLEQIGSRRSSRRASTSATPTRRPKTYWEISSDSPSATRCSTRTRFSSRWAPRSSGSSPGTKFRRMSRASPTPTSSICA